MTVTQETPASGAGGRDAACAGACRPERDCARCERWAAAWGHRGSLLRLARARTVSLQDAEDVVADAMVRAVDADVPSSALGPWLNIVVRNLTVDLHRDRAREPKRRAFTLRHSVPDALPDERLCEQAEARWLHGRLGDLPVRQQQALELKASGLPVSEIAVALGESYKSTESLLSRGRAALRRTLQASLGLGAVALVLPRRWTALGTAGVGTAAVLAGLTTALVLPPADAGRADRAVVPLPATVTSASITYPVPALRQAAGEQAAVSSSAAHAGPGSSTGGTSRPLAPARRAALVPLPQAPSAPLVGRPVHQDAPSDPDVEYGVAAGPSQAPVHAAVETKDEPEQRAAHDAACVAATLTPATYCRR